MKRLQAVLNVVERNWRVVDIGSDHCKIPNALLEKGCTEVYATEVAEGPFRQASKHCDPRVKLRLHDGLRGFEEEIDCAVIAGMGGELIARILEESREKFQSLEAVILQPMQQIQSLRDYLLTSNYQILGESLIYESPKYYQILRVKAGAQEHYDTRFPSMISDEILFQEYLQAELKKIESIPERHRSDSMKDYRKEILARTCE